MERHRQYAMDNEKAIVFPTLNHNEGECAGGEQASLSEGSL